MGVRVHKLAKELDLDSKELIKMLHSNFGIKVQSHLSSVHEDIANNIRREVSAKRGGGGSAQPGKPKPAGPKAKTGNGADAPKKKPVRHIVQPRRQQPLIVRPKNPVAPREPGRGGRPGQGRPPSQGRSSGPGAGRGAGGGGARPAGGGRPNPANPSPAPPEFQKDGRGRNRKVRTFFPGKDGGAQRSRPRGPGGHGGHRPAGRGRGGPRRRGPDRYKQRDVLSEDRPTEISIVLPITLKEFSAAIGIKQNMILKELMASGGPILNVNSHLSEDMIDLIGEKFEVKIDRSEETKIESTLEDLESATNPEGSLEPRAPVVTILGHADHGKTSLLDKIREAHVAAGEAGGITQHMSAYRVDHKNAHVVFIDTPGHEAFTEMRARGANVTDVVVLVVAADDGVMPQTEEAIQHARAAEVPIVVALNKMDKDNANPNRVKEQLAKLDLAPPDWGGSTEVVEMSALAGRGIEELLELLTLETEILELTANPDKPAIGTVLDSEKTPGRGIVTTCLVQEGTLRKGDIVLCGPAFGQVRQLHTTSGISIESAGPATPVEITGLDDLPGAGDRMYVLEDIQRARAIADERKRRTREQERAQRIHVTLDSLFEQIQKGETKEVKLVMKADVKGSLEVLQSELQGLSTSEVGVRVIRHGVGGITQDDILLADASDAIVLGFHVMPDDAARKLADYKNVEIRTYQVIYELLNDIRSALEGMLSPTLSEAIQSSIEVREIFKASRLGKIAGCFVRSGTVHRDDLVRLVRDGTLIYEGRLNSLKRFKDDAKEVREGMECGLRIDGFDDIKVGDMVETYKIVETARTLSDVTVKEGS